MLNVFTKMSAEELYVQLSDGRMMLMKDLLKDYERLLKEEDSKEEPLKESITSELKVGKWFRIDREVIVKNGKEIQRKCNEAGTNGKKLWERFEKSNKIADENPKQYPHLIETYIFDRCHNGKTEQEMRDMCEAVGDGMCDEVICDLELQMRIIYGESVINLLLGMDRLPRVRIIKLRNGGTGFFGGGVYDCHYESPAKLYRYSFKPNNDYLNYTPYAFSRVLSYH